MKIRGLILMIVLSAFPPAVFAAQGGNPFNGPKGNEKMPVSGSPEMRRAAEVLDALHAAETPDLKKEIAQSIGETVRAVSRIVRPQTVKIGNLKGYYDSRQMEIGSTTVVSYYYQISRKNPYDTIRVEYDSETGDILSATAYRTTDLDAIPDLSGMELIYTAYRGDTVAKQVYQSETTKSGAITYVTLSYDSDGTLDSVVETFVQPLDPKKVKPLHLAH